MTPWRVQCSARLIGWWPEKEEEKKEEELGGRVAAGLHRGNPVSLFSAAQSKGTYFWKDWACTTAAARSVSIEGQSIRLDIWEGADKCYEKQTHTIRHDVNATFKYPHKVISSHQCVCCGLWLLHGWWRCPYILPRWQNQARSGRLFLKMCGLSRGAKLYYLKEMHLYLKHNSGSRRFITDLWWQFWLTCTLWKKHNYKNRYITSSLTTMALKW